MKAPQTLRRPTNWQDFETLCFKLWSEIWQCPEIKKHGRTGNDQQGVDVYGIPKGETAYYGIQCKGKDEYTDQQLTEKEIEDEIVKARSFSPPLKKFYIVTTAVRNARIEAFVRKKNLENISLGEFEIHLFAWEDIVDLIDQHKTTYDWYVNDQNYKLSRSIRVTFLNGETVLKAIPKFRKRITKYTQQIVPAYSHPAFEAFNRIHKQFPMLGKNVSLSATNLSFIEVGILIHNEGSEAIENIKLTLKFEGNIVAMKESNVNSLMPSVTSTFYSNTVIQEKELTVQITKQMLVGDDKLRSEKIFIKTSPIDSIASIQWKLVSKNYRSNGVLKIEVRPQIETQYDRILTDDPLEARKPAIESEIEDYIVDSSTLEENIS